MASDIGQSTVQSENKAGVAENKTLTAFLIHCIHLQPSAV